MKTERSQKSMRGLRLVGEEESGPVLSRYGPVRAGLTTLPDRATVREEQLRQLTELLNSLESAVANLNYKSSTALDTLVIATQGVRVALRATPIEEGGTK